MEMKLERWNLGLLKELGCTWVHRRDVELGGGDSAGSC